MNKYSLNEVTLVGRVGQDPEVKQLKNDFTVANLSLATTRSEKRNGKYEDVTSWHRVVLLGKIAEIAQQYVTKGSMIGIKGHISYRKWEKDGKTNYITEIVGDGLTLLSTKDASKDEKREPDSYKAKEPDNPDDELPF